VEIHGQWGVGSEIVAITYIGNRTKAPPDKSPFDKTPLTKKKLNNEIIIESYYICFILMVILKDILKK
jgi:hypothetical protein